MERSKPLGRARGQATGEGLCPVGGCSLCLVLCSLRLRLGRFGLFFFPAAGDAASGWPGCGVALRLDERDDFDIPQTMVECGCRLRQMSR